MKTLKELKTQREETLAKFRVNFRFLMGLVESFCFSSFLFSLYRNFNINLGEMNNV